MTLQGGFKSGQEGQASDEDLNELGVDAPAEWHVDLGRGNSLWLKLAFPGGLS